MMKNHFFATVIIPTYNYAHYIQEAIDSVLNSNFAQSEIEIIVVDDGSTDNTKDVIEKYGGQIKYIHQENKGKATATQVGINEAQGKYIFNLDADDYFLPSKIQEITKVFESNPEIVHVAHPAIYWNMDQNTKKAENIPDSILNKEIEGKELLSYFYKKNILFGGGSTFAGRADALKSFTIPQAIDMYIDEYLVLFTVNQGKSFFISQPLSIWRIHGKNFSGNKQPTSTNNKAMRSLSSMNAVRDSILAEQFTPDLKEIYTLKCKVANVAYKESINQKSIHDIFDLLLYVLTGLSHIDDSKLSIIKKYTLINRTLPTFFLDFLKNIKSNLQRK